MVKRLQQIPLNNLSFCVSWHHNLCKLLCETWSQFVCPILHVCTTHLNEKTLSLSLAELSDALEKHAEWDPHTKAQLRYTGEYVD